MQDIRQSQEYATYMQKIGWLVEYVSTGGKTTHVFIKKLPLVGSVIKIQRPNPPIPFDEIELLARKYRALFVKIEPNRAADHPSFQRSFEVAGSRPPFAPKELRGGRQQAADSYITDSWPLLPTKTIVIDLDKSEGKLLNSFDKTTRYQLRQAQKNNLQVQIAQNTASSLSDIKQFSQLWHKNAQDKGFWIPFEKQLILLWQSFGHKAFLVTASDNNRQQLAGALILVHDQTAYYLHAFSTPTGRKQSAPTMVVWEAMKLAKAKNCRLFDFEGVYDPRYHKYTRKWLGFTSFKQGFGGQERVFPAPIIHRRPLWVKIAKL
ncbi:peptidoglycan bridge formation glycyltransferase FemA/FemB family protein [Candidatus Daviesbacteria bacterium]|nr:peptidoglycan bridge formation glycyltransferase FemA/FemB family protein [Candidatus Daviesbacteria bacterium]